MARRGRRRVGHILMRAAIVAALFLVGAGWARADALHPGCDPREDPTICLLQADRNDALDHYAQWYGTAVRLQDWMKRYLAGIAAQRRNQIETRDYWRRYVDGIDEVARWHRSVFMTPPGGRR